MNILIVEDEALAAEKLEHMVKTMEQDARILGSTGSIKSTVQWLKQHPHPDIILMDIELSDGHSFDIFNQVDVSSTIIFTTSYDEYAIQAFKVNSIDYLLKPVQKEDLALAFSKYRRLKQAPHPVGSPRIDVQQLLQEMKTQLQPKEYRSRFLVRQGQKFIPIDVADIAYFFVDGRGVFFKTFDNRKFIIDYILDELEEMLLPGTFFRVNRSYIVAAKSIQQLNDYVNSRVLLTLRPATGEAIIVSRDRVSTFKRWIGK